MPSGSSVSAASRLRVRSQRLATRANLRVGIARQSLDELVRGVGVACQRPQVASFRDAAFSDGVGDGVVDQRHGSVVAVTIGQVRLDELGI
jgi:hypothetical protein